MDRDDFDERLDEAARALRPELREGAFEELWARHLEEAPPPPLRFLRHPLWRSAAAAVLFLAAFGGWRFVRSLELGAAPTPSPVVLVGLLDSSSYQAARDRQEVALAEHARLVEENPDLRAPDSVLSPLLEEVRFLDEAITECGRALEGNPQHRHLRERMLELAERRNVLLGRWNEENRG